VSCVGQSTKAVPSAYVRRLTGDYLLCVGSLLTLSIYFTCRIGVSSVNSLISLDETLGTIGAFFSIDIPERGDLP
jgi:hypothetical protein